MTSLVWNVLLVDDLPEYRYLFEHGIADARLPVQVHALEGALAAMTFLANQGEDFGKPRPDLIVTDLNMPILSGLQLLELLKNSRWSTIPVLVQSTSARLEDQRTARILGAVDFWTKPALYDDMLRQLPGLMRFLGTGPVEGATGKDRA